MTYATSADLSLGLVIGPESFPTLCATTQRLCLSVPFEAYCSSVGPQNFTGVLTKIWLLKGEARWLLQECTAQHFTATSKILVGMLHV